MNSDLELLVVLGLGLLIYKVVTTAQANAVTQQQAATAAQTNATYVNAGADLLSGLFGA